MKELINNILSKYLQESHLFPVSVELKGSKIEVLLDGDMGISINECAEINRHMCNELDKQGVDSGKYIFEVASAGFESPINSQRTLAKNVGRKLQLVTKDNKMHTGILNWVEKTKISLSIASKKTQLNWFEINNLKEIRIAI